MRFMHVYIYKSLLPQFCVNKVHSCLSTPTSPCCHRGVSITFRMVYLHLPILYATVMSINFLTTPLHPDVLSYHCTVSVYFFHYPSIAPCCMMSIKFLTTPVHRQSTVLSWYLDIFTVWISCYHSAVPYHVPTSSRSNLYFKQKKKNCFIKTSIYPLVVKTLYAYAVKLSCPSDHSLKCLVIISTFSKDIEAKWNKMKKKKNLAIYCVYKQAKICHFVQ